MKKPFIAIILFLIAGTVYSQPGSNNDSGAVRRFLQKVHRAYDQAEKLSFRVQYQYANKNQPGNYIDTMSGEIAMDKNKMRFVIAGTETIVNAKYTIRIIEDEKLIYLAKASRAGVMDPVSMLDSLLIQQSGGQAGIVSGKLSSTLTIRFPPGQPYSNISMTIDERTGFFQKVIYNIHTTGLVDVDQINQPDRPGPYESEGKVEVIFSNYQKGKFNDSLFDEAAYFIRQGNIFEPSGRYNGYRVFVASPNL